VVVEDGGDGAAPSRWLERLRGDARTAYVPVMVAGVHAGRRSLALRRGADDFVTAPLDAEELASRAAGIVRRSRALRAMSPLTALPGNVDIDAALSDAIANPSARYAVLYADVDNFKGYNDSHGFAAGDAALQATARVLTHALSRRPGTRNFIGHLGGDDFVLVTDLDNAVALCRDIIATFDEQVGSLEAAPPLGGGRTVRGREVAAPLAISIGVATNARRPLASVWEISAVATEMKQRAKQAHGSSFAIDHRRGFARADHPGDPPIDGRTAHVRGRMLPRGPAAGSHGPGTTRHDAGG
jgi:diguanylate cyclase (GGDEF)-like protein